MDAVAAAEQHCQKLQPAAGGDHPALWQLGGHDPEEPSESARICLCQCFGAAVSHGAFLHPGPESRPDPGLSAFSVAARAVHYPARRRLFHDLCHGRLLAVDDRRLLFHGLHAGPPRTLPRLGSTPVLPWPSSGPSVWPSPTICSPSISSTRSSRSAPIRWLPIIRTRSPTKGRGNILFT